MENRYVSIPRKYATRLSGVVSSHKGDSALAIMCHGLLSNREAPTMLAIAEQLYCNGIATLRFDFHGHGKSQGDPENITTSQAIDDVCSVMQYAKHKLGYNRIGLVGVSWGASAEILAAAEETNLLFLACKAPIARIQELEPEDSPAVVAWQSTGYRMFATGSGGTSRLPYSFYQDACLFDGYAAAAKITAPSLIVHGAKDHVAPISQSEKLATLMPNCTLQRFANADHPFTDPDDFSTAVKTMSNFVVDQVYKQ